MTKVDELASSGIIKQAGQFIQQVGFPVVAFMLMFYVVYVSQAKMTDAITAQTKVLVEMNVTMQAFQARVQADHDKMMEDLTQIKYNKKVE